MVTSEWDAFIHALSLLVSLYVLVVVFLYVV